MRGRWATATAQARSGMQGRARLEVGARVRTLNMRLMLVTLDVSKSSTLLNFSAHCRVAREGIRSEGEVRARR